MKNQGVFTLGEEIANSISHGLGALAVLLFMPFLIAQSAAAGALLTVGVCIFSATALLLYLASTLYHSLPPGRAKNVFRVLDHSAIYLLIAGTYTPFTIGVLPGAWGWTLFVSIWAMAIGGIILKSVRLATPAWLSTGLYVVMGWSALVVAGPLFSHLPWQSAFWLIAGGAAYTLGVIFFVLDEKIKYTHFVWHLFVLAGTGCHFAALQAL